MNKKGQLFMYGLMVAFIAIVALTQLIVPFKENIQDVRGADKMNCSSDDLSTGENGTCVIIDWAMFYWLGTGLAMAIGFLTWKTIKPS